MSVNFMSCQTEVSTTGRSLVRSIPTEMWRVWVLSCSFFNEEPLAF